ncbi:trichothecene 3-o-acetyltransferase [Apodospora peruviana]|uniref:Trichothecene 3-o-acetyltransferase n=1 Tax=Apodospora peruviana TaxID=516989 RepID=A0AAE0HW69_9PEZI|nr:trichothecene 3-o-acetyltransferase [Apodospora peruviana]
MGSHVQSSGDLLPLTALERIGPKGYLRYVFPFELAQDYEIGEVHRILQAGYEALAKRLPVVGAEAVPDPDSKQAGVLKLQALPADDDARRILLKDLQASGAFPMSYAELKAKNFPLSAFDGEILTRRSVWPVAGDRLPVSLVQANFVQGGLILTWCILHTFGDGNSFLTWTKVWAEECRRAQGLPISDPVVLDPAMFADRERVMKPSGRNPGRVQDHPEYTILPFTPQGPPPKMLSASHRGQIFYFSKESLAALKAEAAPANASDPTDQTWISTNDALSALLWRTVMAVQSPLDTLQGDPVSVFNIAIDGRLRTDPPVHPRTVGCFLEYVAVSAPIRDMLSSLKLADLAVMIRKALLKADNQFTDDVTALVEKLEDVDRLVATAFLDVPGYNCVQTSWTNFELYGLDWGAALGGAIQAVRSPSVGILNGLQVVLPVLPDGGMEILVGVEESCLNRLLHEPLWVKFAKAR